MKKLRKFVILLLLINVMSLAVYAGGGNGGGGGNGDGGGNDDSGSGDGSGDGGGTAQLTLVASTPTNQGKDFDINGEINLEFSNNVVNMAVNENNKTCFKLTDSKDNDIAIEVIMGDDQIDPTIKNNVTIKPLAALSKNETYTLTIAPKMQAKNGSTLEEKSTLEFSTPSDSNSLFINILIVLGSLVVGFIISKIIRKKR